MRETRIGAFTVTRVEEMLTPGFDPAFLFPQFDPAIYDEEPMLAGAAFRDAASGKTMSSMQSWLVRDGRNVIVIDTGCGNGKAREFPAFRRFHMLDLPYLDRLAEAGVQPEQVTHVINTHLHVDHVGWNTVRADGRWTPTFPKARYYFETVQAGETILPGLSFEAIPGHTLGQLGVRLMSQGASALFSGDVFHQPMQIVRPGWNSRFCEHQDIARVTRARVLDENADTGTVIFPSHFGAPHAGTVRRSGSGYRFNPLPVHA